MTSEDSNLGLMVRYTLRAFTQALQGIATSHKLTAAEFRVLRTLASGGPLTQVEIANLAAMDRPYAASTVRLLRQKKLIRGVPHPNDARRVTLLLTPKGDRVVQAISTHLSRINSLATEGVNSSEYKTFLKVLVLVRQNLQREVAAMSPSESRAKPQKKRGAQAS